MVPSIFFLLWVANSPLISYALAEDKKVYFKPARLSISLNTPNILDNSYLKRVI